MRGLRTISLVFLALYLAGGLSVLAAFKVPRLTGPVVDTADILSSQTESLISQALRQLKAQGGSQVSVLTVSNLGELTIEQASIQVVDQWQLGGGELDKGVLLMVAKSERRMRIEVGQGLEGRLTDAWAKRIIDETITPLFKVGDFNAGVIAGVYEIVKYTDPEISIKDHFKGNPETVTRTRKKSYGFSDILFFILFFCFYLLPLLLRRCGYGVYLGGSSWGSGGGFSSGSGWSGGGGGFSGGGASGGW